mmetsp:Transcript_16374/g.34610  ORF Transcript_16374/g.34610 Transcript_16374/m.34610 type:complete len:224 (+) Transcript_16374:1551-2222(+)
MKEMRAPLPLLQLVIITITEGSRRKMSPQLQPHPTLHHLIVPAAKLPFADWNVFPRRLLLMEWGEGARATTMLIIARLCLLRHQGAKGMHPNPTLKLQLQQIILLERERQQLFPSHPTKIHQRIMSRARNQLPRVVSALMNLVPRNLQKSTDVPIHSVSHVLKNGLIKRTPVPSARRDFSRLIGSTNPRRERAQAVDAAMMKCVVARGSGIGIKDRITALSIH